MKNMRKRMLSLMVVLMMSLSLVQPTAFAAGEETGTDGAGDINIQTVVVDNSAANTPDTTPSTTDTTPAPETSDGGNASDGQEAPGGDENPGDSGESEFDFSTVERPEQSDTVEVAPGAPSTEGTDSDEETTPPAEGDDTTPPVEEADPGEKVPPAGDESTKPESDNPWEVFYDEENDTYKLTFNIKENAEGNQVLDLTNALELLGQYADASKKRVEEIKAEEAELIATKPAEPGMSAEDKAKLDAYEAEMAEIDEFYEANVEAFLDMANRPGWAAEHTKEECIAEWNYYAQMGWYGPLPTIVVPEKPEIQEVDKNSEEYKAYEAAMTEYEKAYAEWQARLTAAKVQANANILEPGDIRKFEIFFSSDSKHVYKYKDGSFVLATPEWNTTDGEATGFDGQILPGEYIDKAEYHVTLRCDPIQNLLVKELGVDEWDAWNSLPGYVDNQVKKYLAEKYGQDTVSANLNAYLLDYYNSKDGTSYATIDELVKNNDAAKAELTKTDTSGNKFFDINGETFIVDAHLETVKYDNFYKELFSFVYGDKADIDAITGDMVTNGQYENDSWTNEGHKAALYYYMAHQEIWAETNQYFAKLLEGGLTAGQAFLPSFMMALNIDGELTGNDWQNTKWPWYNSIELEQMDFSFNLTKTDMETGELIADTETGFAIWYNKDDGTKMYCQRDENGNYYFDTTEAVVTTTSGELNIDFALLKDIVYYLQEVNAPDGYQVDPTVYLLMNREDYDTLSETVKAQIAEETGGNHGFLDLTVSEDGLSVSTEFGNVKIVTPPDRPTPTPTPDPDPDPEEPPVDVPDPDVPLVPGPDPEEPPVDIPEEDPPLVDIPEEQPPLVDVPDPDVPLAPRPSTPNQPVPGVDIPDEDVPLADVPNTGDGTGLWCTLGLMAGAGLVYLFLEEKKRQNSAK